MSNQTTPTTAREYLPTDTSRADALRALSAARAAGRNVKLMSASGIVTVPGRGVTAYVHYFLIAR